MNSQYFNNSIRKYIDDLSAKLPAPGGGSAAALSACLGASLISMVVNYTIGKPKYAEYELKLKSILEKSEMLKEEFLKMMDLDVDAYNTREVRNALNVPFMLARLSFEAAKVAPPLIRIGNVNLISDVAVATVLLESAFVAACYNVEINLKMLKDAKLTKSIQKELGRKEKIIKKIRHDTEVKVGKIIRG